MLEAILFDLDDTLLDRGTALKGLFYKIWQEWYHGAPPPDAFERFEEWDGKGYNSKAELFINLFAAYPPLRPADVKEAVAFFYREFPNCFVFPAEHRAWLSDIAGRYRTAIVTNGATQVQWGKIRRAGLEEMVDTVVISEEAGFSKPDARIFQLALDRLGVAAEKALFVGDNLTNDIAGAQAAGMRAVWVRPGGTPGREGIRPDAEIADLTELSRLLESPKS